jgi:TolB-like protein
VSGDPEQEYFRRRDHRPAGYHSRLVSQAIPATLTLPDKPSIAVLPFQNMSGDPEQDYFADGMVEDIITALSRIPLLFVIARSSSFAYKDKAFDVRQVGRDLVGRDLGVRYVTSGCAMCSKAACARRAEARRRSRSGSGDRHPAAHHAACWATVADQAPFSVAQIELRPLHLVSGK